LHRLDEVVYRGYYLLNEEGFYEFAVFLVLLDEDIVERVVHMVSRRFPEFEANLKVVIGVAEYDEETGQVYGFKPYEEISSYRHM
jgi:hypothetical protein